MDPTEHTQQYMIQIKITQSAQPSDNSPVPEQQLNEPESTEQNSENLNNPLSSLI